MLPINKTFKPLQHNERTILEHNHLHIYNVKMEDAGMYRCQIGDSNSLVVLEVVDTDEKYSVVSVDSKVKESKVKDEKFGV